MQISGLSPRAAGQGQTSFTRTLVGPLVSNAQKLLDEHRKAGIFFLFQDLSVRTEGEYGPGTLQCIHSLRLPRSISPAHSAHERWHVCARAEPCVIQR